MKIAVNLLPIREKLGGSGKYSQMILIELAKFDKENHYYLFVSEKGKINFPIDQENFHFIIAKFNPSFVLNRIFWEQIIFPFKLFILKPDIIFVPSVAIPFLYNGRFLTTIHDIAYKKNKKKYSFIRSFYISIVTWISIKKSRTIFTVSNFSRTELLKEFKIKKNNILITYNGVEDIFFLERSSESIIQFRAKFGLPDQFILYVGAIEPGKNLDKLFLAFAIISKNYSNLKLVLTAGLGWSQNELYNMIGELSLKNKIVFLPYIENKDLPLLYRSATMLIYLSSYEGFGIPVLEAMASGIPVIASKSAAINEFATDSIIAVNPENIDEVVHRIEKILSDKSFRQVLIQKGISKAKDFKWSKSAKVVFDNIISIKK